VIILEMGYGSMAKLRKSWREKLVDSKDLPRVVEITDTMSKRWSATGGDW